MSIIGTHLKVKANISYKTPEKAKDERACDYACDYACVRAGRWAEASTAHQ
jgi:hypothetical protein